MKISTARLISYSLIALICGMILAGCGSRKMQRGAAIGAGAGATVGALIGKTAGNTALGTIIGGAIGGTAGAYIGHKMDNALPGDRPVITDASVSRDGDGFVVKFDKPILFEKGGVDVSTDGQASLSNLAKYLRQAPQSKITIIGYTDTLGNSDYNKSLSVQRADAVKTILIADSVSATRLTTQGNAGAEPVGDNKTPEGQAKNRRAEIIVITSDKAKAQAKEE